MGYGADGWNPLPTENKFFVPFLRYSIRMSSTECKEPGRIFTVQCRGKEFPELCLHFLCTLALSST